MHHLLDGVGRPGLLAVAEGRVGDDDVAGLAGACGSNFDRLAVDVLDDRPVEADQRRQAVVEGLFQQVRLGRVDQRKRFLWPSA